MGVLAMVGMRMRCHRAARHLQAYLDGEADAAAAAAVAAHLEECRRCGLEASTYAAIKAAVALRQDTGPAPAVDPAVLARLDRFAHDLSSDVLDDPADDDGAGAP